MGIDLNMLDRVTRERILMKESMDPTFGNALSEDFTEELFKILDERRKKGVEHAFISSWFGLQGSSKSWASLSLAGFLDPNFNIDKIFFDFDILVNERGKLKSKDCIVVDEQTKTYGIDSNRINVMIQTMKEQLRKRSISMIYVSPILREEYHTSQFVFETMFVDNENKVSYHAMKTNELHTLGYVIIPHPLHFISKDLLLTYEKKKDKHLDEVLHSPVDMVEERAKSLVKNPLFLKAESIYKKARGYIPYKILVQIVEKIYPEFKGSVVVYELADRIKCNCEVENRWVVVGNSN